MPWYDLRCLPLMRGLSQQQHARKHAPSAGISGVTEASHAIQSLQSHTWLDRFGERLQIGLPFIRRVDSGGLILAIEDGTYIPPGIRVERQRLT